MTTANATPLLAEQSPGIEDIVADLLSKEEEAAARRDFRQAESFNKKRVALEEMASELHVAVSGKKWAEAGRLQEQMDAALKLPQLQLAMDKAVSCKMWTEAAKLQEQMDALHLKVSGKGAAEKAEADKAVVEKMAAEKAAAEKAVADKAAAEKAAAEKATAEKAAAEKARATEQFYYIPKTNNGAAMVVNVGPHKWRISPANNVPVAYRRSKNLGDRVEGTAAQYGQELEAFDEGDGWLRVPMKASPTQSNAPAFTGQPAFAPAMQVMETTIEARREARLNELKKNAFRCNACFCMGHSCASPCDPCCLNSQRVLCLLCTCGTEEAPYCTGECVPLKSPIISSEGKMCCFLSELSWRPTVGVGCACCGIVCCGGP